MTDARGCRRPPGAWPTAFVSCPSSRPSTLAEDAQLSELARRVTGHLGWELAAIVPVMEWFPRWDHVNVQRGVDAHLAAHQTVTARNEPEWFGAPFCTLEVLAAAATRVS